jgi:hypothetical protein
MYSSSLAFALNSKTRPSKTLREITLRETILKELIMKLILKDFLIIKILYWIPALFLP